MSLKVEEDDGRTARRDEMRAIESERERGGQISRDLRCLCNEYDEEEKEEYHKP